MICSLKSQGTGGTNKVEHEEELVGQHMVITLRRFHARERPQAKLKIQSLLVDIELSDLFK